MSDKEDILRSYRNEMINLLQSGARLKILGDIEKFHGVKFANLSAWSYEKLDDILKRLNFIKNFSMQEDIPLDRRKLEDLIALLGHGKIEQISKYGQEIIDLTYPVIKNCQAEKRITECRSNLLDLYIIGSKLFTIGDIKYYPLDKIKYDLIQEGLEKLDEINKHCIGYYKDKELNDLLEAEVQRLINIMGSLDIERSKEYAIIMINAISSWTLEECPE